MTRIGAAAPCAAPPPPFSATLRADPLPAVLLSLCRRPAVDRAAEHGVDDAQGGVVTGQVGRSAGLSHGAAGGPVTPRIELRGQQPAEPAVGLPALGVGVLEDVERLEVRVGRLRI